MVVASGLGKSSLIWSTTWCDDGGVVAVVRGIEVRGDDSWSFKLEMVVEWVMVQVLGAPHQSQCYVSSAEGTGLVIGTAEESGGARCSSSSNHLLVAKGFLILIPCGYNQHDPRGVPPMDPPTDRNCLHSLGIGLMGEASIGSAPRQLPPKYPSLVLWESESVLTDGYSVTADDAEDMTINL
ncbi:hypothetical protein Tco_1077903 [Tanacetum coccineum]